MMSFAFVVRAVICGCAKKGFLFSPVFKPRLRLGQKTQARTKNIHFLALISFLTQLILIKIFLDREYISIYLRCVGKLE
jgi:hypothetical protein